MDKWQAQQAFWEGFGLPAYDENTVPDEAKEPYITYQAIDGNLDAQTQVSASLWYHSNSWAAISQKASEIAKAINDMPTAVKIDGGYMKIRLSDGTPFAQRMNEPDDRQVRRILMTVEIEFLTAY